LGISRHFMQPISQIKAIKLYYPFLRDRNISIREQYKNILSYLLLTDVLILPPDHIFNEGVIYKNADFIKKNELIRESFKNGLIISTATDLSIRDYKDLIFERSKKENIKIPNFTIPLYYRNGIDQKKAYLNFFLKEFKIIESLFYEKQNIRDIVKLAKSNQGHYNFLKNIHRINFSEEERSLIEYTKQIAKIAYLKGGADGNHAIMPTVDSTNEYTFFNDYYSLRFVQQFAIRVSKHIKCDITELNFDKFFRLVETLKSFKDEYNEKCGIFKDLDDDVYNALVKINNGDNYRKYKKGINFLVGFILAEIIDDAVLPLLSLQPTQNYPIKFIIAVIFERYKLMEKSLSIANQIVDQKDFETYLISKFGDVIDKFDNSIKLIT